VAISAMDGTGIPDLLHLLREGLYGSYTPIHVRLPYQQGALISLFHELGQVEVVEHHRGGVTMQGRIPGRLVAQFAPWIGKNGKMEEINSSEDEAFPEEA
jgi:GTP-binding protein HflX